MKIILLKPNFSTHKGFLGNNYFVLPNIGIGIIAAILSEEGHEVLIKDPVLEGMDLEDTVSFIVDNNIDLVGLTTVSMHYEGAIQLAREVKRRRQSIITILGGPHFQGIGEECLEKNSFVDYICVGEGDHLISELIKCDFNIDCFSDISGLVYESQLHQVGHLKTVDIDIKYSTGHTNGSVYGLPAKLNSITPIQNLFFCGTDQGFLGIVGTTLSSISMVNLHILQKKVAPNTQTP